MKLDEKIEDLSVTGIEKYDPIKKEWVFSQSFDLFIGAIYVHFYFTKDRFTGIKILQDDDSEDINIWQFFRLVEESPVKKDIYQKINDMQRYASELSNLLDTIETSDIQIEDYQETQYDTVVYFILKKEQRICFGAHIEKKEFELFIDDFSYAPDYVEHLFTEKQKEMILHYLFNESKHRVRLLGKKG
jgi:hypothetical protein